MALDDFHVDRLFIAVPELTLNISFTDSLYRMGVIDDFTMSKIRLRQRQAKAADKVLAAAMSGNTLIERLMAVAPELINVQMVDLLAGVTWNERRVVIAQGVAPEDRRHYVKKRPLISATHAHALRLAVRSLNAASRGGLPTDRSQLFSRLVRVMGVQFSKERIDMWRSMGLITSTEAERWNGYLRTGDLVKESLAKAKRAKSLTDALLIIGAMPVDKSLIRAMVASGVIPVRVAEVYIATIDLGVKQWKVFEGARSAEGFRTRMLLALSGSFNRELLGFLRTTGVIDRRQMRRLMIAEQVSRQVNDHIWDSVVKRRYRVQPGVPPIRTFAKVSRANDADILRLLAEAARESSREARKLGAKSGIGAATRARQYRLEARGLHTAMRSMWEGVGYLTILGESQVAEAAAESALAMQRGLLSNLPPGMEQSLLFQADAGVDAFISREENTLPLSRRVYKNIAFYEGKVDQRIKLGLLQGLSAEEMAKSVERLINPKVPGGVSYAAMRLARTEIQNAFHFSLIRHTRESPWVRGYKWNLSGSHPKPDICNKMAEDDHDNMGAGVYKKANVPGKPHPHCFCYITVVQMSEMDFLGAYRSGRFTSYLRQVARGQAYENPSSSGLGEYVRRGAQNAIANAAA